MSTDAKPMHSKCSDGKLSWCFYNRAKVDNKVPGSHKSMKTKLSEEVVAKIMPVYQRLASNEILLRCVSGKTQNANESLHSCIWRKCPKDVFVSKKRINLAVTAAVSEVNIGYVETLKLNNNEMVDAAFLKLPTDAITEDALFICYKQSPDNAHSVAFPQRSSSPRLIEDETFNYSDFINNLIDYEDGQEAGFFESE
ncbi:uncharacterized protein TNCV_4874401 [Trichonephila clavipes]|nr:uncharacterized protein TNCV_4874401 [Trichonephila clavipes]